MIRRISIFIILFIFLLYSKASYLSAQEKQDAREQAREHYLQGKALYSQGRYEEATAEFEKAAAESEKAIELISPTRLEFMKDTQRGLEETLIPSIPGLPKVKPPPEKKLTEREKEIERQEQEVKATEVTALPGPKIKFETKEREYYIDIGDVFDVSVWQMPSSRKKLIDKRAKEEEPEDGEYYIDVGDVLDVAVWQVPDLSRSEVIVRPDGKISFPLIGDIKAKGLSLTRLDAVITEKLKTYVRTPEVSIMIRRFGKQQDKMTILSDLSPSEVIVRPDGKISFPLIGDVKAEGLTLPQLDDSITERLKTYVKIPEVSVMIKRFGEKTNKVVVLGEIFAPGIYKFNRTPTVIEVVAAAGGHTKYAVLNSVMVIRGTTKAQPELTRIDIAKVFRKGDLSENIQLNPNDIIYIPRSFIGKFNRFLEVFQPAYSQYLQTLNGRYLHNTIHRGGG